MIKIINDIDLFNDIKKNNYDYILLPTNCYCTFPDGFAHKIRLNYPYVFDSDVNTKYGDINKLGTIIEVTKDNLQSFIILYINKGYNFRPDLQKDFLEYDSLAQCLQRLNIEYKHKSIACPFVGCNRFDGNGDKDRVLNLIKKYITDLDLYIYDYFQKSRNEELIEIFKEEEKIKNIDYKKYKEMVKQRKEEANKRKQINGTALY